MAQEDLLVARDHLGLALPGLPRISLPRFATLDPITGGDHLGCLGDHLLLQYDPAACQNLLQSTVLTCVTAMTLIPQPYYWPTDADYGSSPPLATRTGWMALALLPFVLALSAKANMISALTGIPYEKLQVFHHWTSYAMFVLALIHTFPFIVYNKREGEMVMEWKTDVVYWTGVGAIIPQAYLTFMSVPFIR